MYRTRRGTRRDRRYHLDRSVGVGLLVATKASDAVTTAIGLRYFPALVEGNPVTRTLLESLGIVPGLIVGSAIYVCLVLLAVETGVLVARDHAAAGRNGQRLIRTVGYGPISILSWGVALNNALLIGRLSGGWVPPG